MTRKYLIDYVGGRDQGFKTINTVIQAASLWEAAKVARRLHGLFFITAKRIFTTETETPGYYLRARKDHDGFTQATAYVSRFTGRGA